MIRNEGDLTKEIEKRISSATRLYLALTKSIIGRKEVSRKTKMTIFKTIYRPTLIHGSESWVLNDPLRSRMQVIEMKYLRRVQGLTRRDEIPNEIIRKELEIDPVLQVIENQRLKWFGYLIRMSEQRPTKRVWEPRIISNRKRDRPKLTWNDEMAKILRKRNQEWDRAKSIGKNKREWNKMVYWDA